MNANARNNAVPKVAGKPVQGKAPKQTPLQAVKAKLGDRLKDDKNLGYLLDGHPINTIELIKRFA